MNSVRLMTAQSSRVLHRRRGLGGRGRLAGVVALVAVLGTLLAPAGDVAAHAVLEEVVPADGAVVDTPPSEVTLRFNERVSLTGGDARVLDDSGAGVGGDPAIVDESIIIPLPAGLGDGTYVVTWKVVSADSHPITGTSVFHIGAPSADPDEIRAGAAQSVGGSWLLRLLTNIATAVLYAGVLVAVGAWWFGRVLLPSRSGEVTPAHLRPVVTGAAAVGIGAAIVWWPLRVARLGGGFSSLDDGSFVSDAIRGPIGAAFAVTVVGLALVLFGSRRNWQLCAAGTVLALAGFVFEGHTRTKDPTWAMVVFDLVHLAAGAAWLGGLVGVVLTLRAEPAALRRARAVASFSSMALWTVGVLTAAGIGMAILVLPSLSALVDTGYGLALVTKVILVAGVLSIAGYNRWRLVPVVAESGGERAAADRLSRTVRAELVALALVLATTTVLVSRSPDVSVKAERPPDAVSLVIDLGDGEGTAEVELTPARTGANELSLALVGTDGATLALYEPPVVELREPVLQLGPIDLEIHPLVAGGYHSFFDVPFAGSWELTVRARLDEFTSVSGTSTVTITD
jgi:copper transport protein